MGEINVLSLFDGISCGQLALIRAGFKNFVYYASEIDKNSINVTQHHFPNTIQLGSVTDVDVNEFEKIGLLIGGIIGGFVFSTSQWMINELKYRK